MIQSMTGYGRSEGTFLDVAIVTELRSTNHKYCDIVVRLPKLLLPLESPIKKMIQQEFQRGRLELTVSLNGAAEQAKRIELDPEMANQYVRILKELKSKFDLSGPIDVGLLSGFRDIISVSGAPEASDDLAQRVRMLVKEAMRELAGMRKKEGQALERDLKKRLAIIEKAVRVVESRVPRIIQAYQSRLKDRIKHLTHGIQLDQGRLAQEVALFAERCDIQEEITRLKSHLKQFRGMIQKKESVGRSLDFLIQEMNREVNTIGSKGNDAGVAMDVVSMKSELERVREQVQNVA